jgi:hypothetical protein
VGCSRSGQTVYCNGRALKRIKGGGGSGNYRDIESGEEYWVSGVKRNGQDRHWAGSGKIFIKASVVAECLTLVHADVLDRTRFEITHALVPTDIQRIRRIENFRQGFSPFDEGHD